jgi:hypothetical protein
MIEIKDVIAFGAYILGLGVLWGRQDFSTKQLQLENAERKKEIEDVRHQVSRDVAEIKNLFVTADHEPKYVTYQAHDKLQSACQGMISIQVNYIKEDVVKIKAGQERIERILSLKFKTE